MSHSPLETSLISLRRIIRATEAGARSLARQANMATSELLTLQAVLDSPGVTPGALAKSLSLSPVTSTVILQKLEQRGLVVKVKDNHDKRRIMVELTDAGRQEIQNAPSSLQDKFATEFGKLPQWEQHMLAGALGRITELMGVDTMDAAPILDVGPIDGL